MRRGVSLLLGVIVFTGAFGATARADFIERSHDWRATAFFNDAAGQWAAGVIASEVKATESYLPPGGAGSSLFFNSRGTCNFNGAVEDYEFKWAADHASVTFELPAYTGCGVVQVEWKAIGTWVECDWCRRNVNNDVLHQILTVRTREADAVISIDGVEQTHLTLSSQATLAKTDVIQIWYTD